MKKIYYVIKRIVLALCLLYSFNLIVSKTGLIVPINYYTIGAVTVLGVPGLIAILILKKML